eukprot:Skav216240  [mRNA]  locus=scaffold2025:7128:7760:- [translate_table: standard]
MKLSPAAQQSLMLLRSTTPDLLEAERFISAASRGLNTIVANILDILVDPNTTVNSCTALHMALGPQARMGDIQLIELITLLMDSHSDPNVLDCTGSSPLSLAIRTRILDSTRYDIVDELCKGRADVNARDGSTYTPFHMAAYYGRTSAARRLMNSERTLTVRPHHSLGRGWSHVKNTETLGGLDRKQLFISPQGADTYTQPTCSSPSKHS